MGLKVLYIALIFVYIKKPRSFCLFSSEGKRSFLYPKAYFYSFRILNILSIISGARLFHISGSGVKSELSIFMSL